MYHGGNNFIKNHGAIYLFIIIILLEFYTLLFFFENSIRTLSNSSGAIYLLYRVLHIYCFFTFSLTFLYLDMFLSFCGICKYFIRYIKHI